MATVSVDLSGLDAYWVKASKKAAADLNVLFHRTSIKVVFAVGGSGGATISVKTDPDISGTAVHGNTTTTTSGSGQLQSAEVRLPVKVLINSPAGLRGAGPGVLEVIVAHEFVHALGQVEHNSHLMAQTMTKLLGDTPAGDKLQAGGISLPPLDLASDSIDLLKSLWP